MAFEGYIRYGGVELVNNSRLSAYTKHLSIDGYKCENMCPTLPEALQVLEDARITAMGGTPSQHPIPPTYTFPYYGAPWFDPAEPASNGFAGVHILEWTNIDSSTYTATSQELVTDGASIQGKRYAGRQMQVRCLLLGTDLKAVRHGFNWLTAVLVNGDPCASSVRRRHTYADFLPYGKPWWSIYKNTNPVATGENVFQAVRFNGLSATDDPIDTAIPPGDFPGSGNTYAKLSHAEGDPNIIDNKDALDLLIPLQPLSLDIEDEPSCGGNKLEFFVQCPDTDDVVDVYRMMTDVSLLTGPVIIGEHEMGTNCSGGAWYEVEFTLIGTLPFVWRWPVNMLAQGDLFTYAQLRDHFDHFVGSPAVLRKGFYKDADLTTDYDLYQFPLYWREPQTYNGVISALYDVVSGATPPPIVRAGPMVNVQNSLLVLDPECPPLFSYPHAPQEDFLCAPIYGGAYRTLRYSFLNETLPKFTPSTVRFRLVSFSEDAMRDIKVRVIPPSGSEFSASIVEFLITYMPPRSQIFIDGVRRSIDIRTGDPGDATSLVWSPAEHLVLSQGAIGVYTFPEITCGRDVVLAIDVPSIYDASFLEFDLVTVQRDA